MKAAAARRVAEAEAAAQVERIAADRGPLTLREVYAELGRTAAIAVAWRDRMAGVVDGLDALGYAGPAGEQTHHQVQLLERAMDRAARVCELVARLDLDACVAALDQRTAAVFYQVVDGAQRAAGLDPDTWETLRSHIATGLAAVAHQPAPSPITTHPHPEETAHA